MFFSSACLYKIWNVCRMTFLAPYYFFCFPVHTIAVPLSYFFSFLCLLLFFPLSLSLVKCSRLYLFNFCGWKYWRIFHLDALQQSQKILDFNVPEGNWLLWNTLIDLHSRFSKVSSQRTVFGISNVGNKGWKMKLTCFATLWLCYITYALGVESF